MVRDMAEVGAALAKNVPSPPAVANQLREKYKILPYIRLTISPSSLSAISPSSLSAISPSSLSAISPSYYL
jgi:hypothetical protein